MDMKMLDNICKDICQSVDTVHMVLEKSSIIIKSFCQEDSDQLEDLEKSIILLKKDLKEYLSIEISDLDIWFTICSDDTFYDEVDLKRFFEDEATFI